ncbi:ATP-dependent DNA helicase [Anaerosacchariphilus polymeriproducens]|uniref:DNA 5'-3' helicase n=1 Tax=Anaerosacchariphilus polymeriproducens TaxID=1812858 RepID=A0A371ASP8_9FIRM|nr:ATP-dependent DNA helicase [Anaerosacchariphilus polymeriproducens]RDU22562.1 ATP-dependent DNA helicase [Anaerosacchariphilus polymeriproducens]
MDKIASKNASLSEEVIKISVRNLVEFILRTGDIDNRKASGMDKDAMQAGSKMHRKIQKRMGSNYYPEVPLKTIEKCNDFSICIEGRADGILIEEDLITIDEIKGTFKDLEYITEPVFVHKAQAMCYGYIYAKDHQLEEIQIQLTYCNLDNEQVKRFVDKYDYSELESWFLNLVKEYEKWARFQFEWRKTRQKSIQPLNFPFPYRNGQKDLAASVYRTIYRKKKLFIQAPTGVGKTISVVFPAVKAMGENLGEKIFYMTAKTITRTVAQETFQLLKRQGFRGKVVTITAKEKICLCEDMICNPQECPVAKGHYDRINEAVFQLLTSQDEFTREVISDYAERFRVCPFEMCLDITTWSDVIICDYNYVFDPNVYLRRFFGESIKGEYIFLIDEAHNLVERGREMYSASLYKEDFLEVKKIVKYYNKTLERALERCNRNLLEMKRECENYQIHESIGSFWVNILHLMGELEKFMEVQEQLPNQEILLEFYFRLRNFFQIYDRVDENYVIYTELEPDGRFKIRLFCIDTSTNLQGCLDKGLSTIYFSATLLPIQYYKSLLSKNEDDYAIYVKSPFDEKKRLLYIGSDVSSKYTRRGYFEFSKMAEYIRTVVLAKKGNYMVFFPSYRMMEDVYEIFQEYQIPDVDCILQQPNMIEEQRETFLERFISKPEKSLIGFCVMGGVFSEGIDLKNDSLIGTLIVGTGLPQVCNEREILKQYFDERQMNGFDFAYRFQGMNKVLQAAGRVIRTDDDLGVIILMDDRFCTKSYQNQFPYEWKDFKQGNMEQLKLELEDFWKHIS